MARPSSLGPLSRSSLILAAIRAGEPTRQIATRMKITPSTVRGLAAYARRKEDWRHKETAAIEAAAPGTAYEPGEARRDREVREHLRCGAPCWLLRPHPVCAILQRWQSRAA